MIAVAGSDVQEFRTWLFLFANTIMHEIGGHLLVTYLGRGRPLTPPDITTSIPGYSTSTIGESGRYLEEILLDGNMEYCRNPNKGNHQVQLPPIPNSLSVTDLYGILAAWRAPHLEKGWRILSHY